MDVIVQVVRFPLPTPGSHTGSYAKNNEGPYIHTFIHSSTYISRATSIIIETSTGLLCYQTNLLADSRPQIGTFFRERYKFHSRPTASAFPQPPHQISCVSPSSHSLVGDCLLWCLRILRVHTLHHERCGRRHECNQTSGEIEQRAVDEEGRRKCGTSIFDKSMYDTTMFARCHPVPVVNVRRWGREE